MAWQPSSPGARRGGSNYYESITGRNNDEFSTRLSIHPPWSRGFVGGVFPAGTGNRVTGLIDHDPYPYVERITRNVPGRYLASGVMYG